MIHQNRPKRNWRVRCAQSAVLMRVTWVMYSPMLCKISTEPLEYRLTDCGRNLPVDALQSLVQALLSQLPDDASSTIIAVKSDTGNTPVNDQKTTADGPTYVPAFVYILELSTVLTLRNEETLEKLGAEVSEALQNVIRDSTNHHPTVVGRVVFYLMSLLHASYVGINASFSSA